MKKSICFISKNAHYILMNDSITKVGGAEFQQIVIARALRDRGWHVEFITEKFSNRKTVTIDGIKIMGGMDYSIGSRLTRRLVWLPLQLWKLMKLSGAQIFYQRNPGLLSSSIGLFSRLIGKRFVLAGAHDTNFDKNNELNVNNYFDKIDIKLGIQLAHSIILQNSRQRYLLKRNYNRVGSIFYNIYTPPPSFRRAKLGNGANRKHKIIWIARLAREKRPELCIDLARILTEYEIIVVGAREPSKDRQPIIDMAEFKSALPNLTFLGPLPLEKVEYQLDSSQALINTAVSEGFPNTFLQAWSRGIPVFSFVDPDDIITKHSLGKRVFSIEEMAEAIRYALADEALYMQQAKEIRRCYEQNFSSTNRIEALEKILLNA